MRRRPVAGQGAGRPHLLPRAVDLLRRDPSAEGDLHPGDLLSAVLHCAPHVRAARRGPATPPGPPPGRSVPDNRARGCAHPGARHGVTTPPRRVTDPVVPSGDRL
ncbi:contact-dependent growth inhibition system immunity protein [Kitasatospora purpeofusca]|uniref:contact-dependent growth inhibition system immunity protein n=1 Tax=Kitasatospora purpeofusca TaxID=67352 RepID=UPI0036D38ED3